MAKLTTKKVEEKGLRILCDYFAECERIDTYIASNDKEPLWDGHIYLFNSDKQTSNNIYGRIPAQLKACSKTSGKEEIKYGIKKAALNTFKRDGGVVYFVIYINNSVGKQIYYSCLTPLLIKKYLTAPGSSDSVQIKLRQLTQNKLQITEDLFQFHYDCKNQTSSADKPIVKIEEYFNKNGKKEFSVFAKSTEPVKNIFEHLQSHPQYLYATDDNKNITFPIGDGPVTLKLGRHVNEQIFINGTPYFDGCVVFQDETTITLTIGNFFKYEHSKNSSKGTLTFHISEKYCRKKIPYLDFILAIFKYKSFSIGNVKLQCVCEDPNIIAINKIKAELSILIKIRSLLDSMHIDNDICIENLNENEITNLEALYKGIVLKEPLILKKGIERNMRIEVGELVFYVVFSSDGNGKYYVKDFFADDEIYCVLENDHKSVELSRFSALTAEQLAEASNFDDSHLIDSYEKIDINNAEIQQYTNYDMLKMISAYDLSNGCKNKLLDAAEKLNNWFINKQLFKGSPINEINKFQIIRRKRDLTEQENNCLYDIFQSHNEDNIKAGCMILLGNKTGAKYHINNMKDEDFEYFKTLPIYHLYEKIN